MFANQNMISQLVPEFLTFARVELGFAAESIIKYRDCLKQVAQTCNIVPARDIPSFIAYRPVA
jgi:hypothetical protein